jgi:hypothetical protein
MMETLENQFIFQILIFFSLLTTEALQNHFIFELRKIKFSLLGIETL